MVGIVITREELILSLDKAYDLDNPFKMDYLSWLFLLLSLHVDRLLAIEHCYTSAGVYTGYCESNEDCCNNARNCCEESTSGADGGMVAGIVVGVIVVVVVVVICVIIAKKNGRSSVNTIRVQPETNVQHTTTVYHTGGYSQPGYSCNL